MASNTRRTRTAVVLVAAILPTVAASLFAVHAFRDGQAGRYAPLAKALQVCDNADTATEINCVVSVIKTRDRDALIDDAKAVVEVSRTDENFAEGCHTYLHAIGQRLSANSNLPTLTSQLIDLWSPCGFGLLHGVFETVQLPSDVPSAARNVAQACSPTTIGADPRVHGECLHALGHAINDHFPTPSQRVAVCAAAFPDAGNAGVGERIGCYSGVAMKIRDEVLTRISTGTVRIGPTIGEFREVGAACADGDQEWAQSCAPGFVQIATTYGASHVPTFLTWCAEVVGSEASAECSRQAGVYMGHFHRNFSSFEQIMGLCSAGQNVSADSVTLCRASVAEGLRNTGVDAERSVQQVCDVLAAFRDGAPACELARRSKPGA